MLSNFIFSLNATIPIFLLIVLGWVLMRCGILTKGFNDAADKYVFKVALPVLLFEDIATADIREEFDLKFFLFCMIGTILMFLGVWLFTCIFMKDRSMIGAFVQGSARGSAAVLGIAFVNNIYGEAGMAPMMIVAAVPFYNILSVIILSVHSNTKDQNQEHMIRNTVLNVLKNPIIWGIVAGLPFSLLGIDITGEAFTIPYKVVTNIANTATPIALLVVGANFEGRKAIKKIKPTMAATFIKLVLLPAIFLPIAAGMGFRDSELVAILVMVGSPTTVTCYIMAKNMGNDAELSSSIIVMATLLSSVTLTFWVFLMKSLSLI